MSEGTSDKAKGRVKEATGALTDDDDMKHEGRADQKQGEAKDKAEEARNERQKARE